jgi:hypothetical protein
VDTDRIAALEDLLLLRIPVDTAANRVKKFPWDSETEMVVLTTHDCLRLLDGYLSGRLTGGDCELWAFTLEGRDDVGLERGSEPMLKDFLFDTSSPELQGPLTTEVARAWQLRLGGGS